MLLLAVFHPDFELPEKVERFFPYFAFVVGDEVVDRVKNTVAVLPVEMCLVVGNKGTHRRHKRFGTAERLPESLREHYRALAHTAGECVGCRGCEARCPFGVEIAERMARAAELFGQ